ncbi:MAG: glycosyltransferase [Armatimonadota bacterium]|nr:glycosyltransferase [Armatimonadota bacterium]MDR7454355.1 glycosyltransferase [Armatimonadota bacterium]MDR7455973.1 glycosyltransferase [Armatimonadota bacterium]MDR7496156.1 glycosyltransferase [Armatimonadota bacterium]MDR7511351.1 glycosyltransferase [Armatimonadota bacterium]
MVQVSVVLLTWNSSRHIGAAMDALSREIARLPAEVLVIDNGSADDSAAIAAAHLPQARIVRNPTNRGVARARNQGARLARGRYVLFLDSDTEMQPGSLEAMVRFLDTHPTAAVVGPRLVYPDGVFQYSARRFPTVPGKLLRLLPLAWRRTLTRAVSEEMLDADWSVLQRVDYVIGACQLVRREVFEAVGGLDDRMFYGPEDVDLCLRVWQAGGEVYYLPEAVVVHGEQRLTHRRLSLLTLRHGAALAHYFWKHRYFWRRPAFVRARSGRPRVLELITLSEWGGAQACVFTLARGLRQDYDVTVACAPGGPLVARLRAEGIAVVEIPTLVRAPSPFADLRTLLWLAAWMRRERFHIVHCHSTKAGLLGRFAARLAGVPAILFTVHGWPFAGWWHPVHRAVVALAERAAARLSTAMICVCVHDHRVALQMRIAPPDRLVVIPNGVDPAPFLAASDDSPADPDADVGQEAAGPAGRALTAVAVGRLTEQKDPGTLLDAWRRVGGPHVLLLVGDGPLRADLEARCRAAGLAGRVVLTGVRDDVPAVLRRADVFVLASRWEGLPLAIIEAMMSGLPIVATTVGGVPEVVVEGETGLLVSPQDPEALARALERLLGDGALRHRMGAAGRQRALREFAADRMLRQTAMLYARVLDASRRPLSRVGVAGRAHRS